VPPDDEKSNFRMVNEILFLPLKSSEKNIFRWKAEKVDAEAAAREYDAMLKETDVRLDLTLLGLGTDCHTASLFPNNKALEETERWAVASVVPQLGETRLTLTFPVINRSYRILFLVTGGDKAKAVRTVLEGEQDIRNYPAQGVRPYDGSVTFLLDEDAAANLHR
jgi:6-phosphogluconolactonase